MGTLAFHTSSATGGSSRHRRPVFDRIGEIFALGLHEWHVRQTVRALETMDSHMLSDIGLTPGNIEDAVRHGR